MTFDDDLTSTRQRTPAAVDAAGDNVQAGAIVAAAGDPSRPEFVPLPDAHRKFFGDSTEADYHVATIDGRRSYLIAGVRGTSDDFGCYVSAPDREGCHRIVAGVSDRQIAVGDEGTFALYLSTAPPPPHLRRTNWIRLTRAATRVIIRQRFLRRHEQSPAGFDIVCLDSRRSTATTYRRIQAPRRSPQPNSSTPQ